MHYVDLDPGPGALDMACNKLTYDGHKGTDFAITDLKEMQHGVSVLAAASGTVKAVRDGMEDMAVTITTHHEIDGKECGNGVLLDHGNGWTTQYCHMKKDSVQVHPGERVEAGQSLGLVGLSGETEFPHLHFAVRHLDNVIDPFTGQTADAGCRVDKTPLWQDDVVNKLSYRPFVAYNLGFADGPVKALQVRAGKLRDFTPTPTSKALVFWADSIGVYPGDAMTLRLFNPAGEVLAEHTQTFDRFYIRRFQFIGKKLRSTPWPSGVYRGEIVLTRESDGNKKDYVSVKEVLIQSKDNHSN